jgi:hypothetical protein
MANLNADGVSAGPQQRDRVMAHVYGNVANKTKKVRLPITGAGSAVADTVTFMRLPIGARIIDFYERHDGAQNAATTGKIGLAAVTGGKTTYVDDDYFLLNTLDLNAAGFNRWNNLTVYSVTLDDDYLVVLTLAAQAIAVAMDVEVSVTYEFTGST